MATHTQALDDEKATTGAAPYVSWATFKNAIDGLAAGGVPPNQIDRSVFPGLAGGVQSALLAAMKFLGLTDTNGKPTKYLAPLCDVDEAERKEVLADVLRRSYPELFDLPIATATVKQVHDKMDTYGCNGETKDKAFRFFLGAVQYAEVPVSRLLVNGIGSVSSRKRPPPGSRKPASLSEEAPPPAPRGEAEAPAAMQRTVKLVSGGSLTLTGSFDPFNLGPEDRIFVFGLVDQMAKYKGKDGPS